MAYLLFKIFILMLLAAAFGAWLAWWWLRRNFEDVTETHEDMLARSALLKDAPPVLTRDEFDAGVTNLTGSISGIRMPDLSAVHERLIRIENALVHTSTVAPGLTSLGERLGKLETHMSAPQNSLEPVNGALGQLTGRLADLETAVLSMSTDVSRLENADLGTVESRLARIEDMVRTQTFPETDLAPLHADLARIEMAIEGQEFPITDIQPLRTHLNAMETRLAEFAERLDGARKTDIENMTIRMSTLSSSLAGLRMPDLDPIRERLARIEAGLGNIAAPEQDLSPLIERLRQIEMLVRAPGEEFRSVHTKLADLEGGTASLHSKLVGVENNVNLLSRSTVDLGPLQSRLAALETAIAAVRVDVQSLPDPSPMERRLAALQESILTIREPDLSPVLASVRKIDNRLDLGAVENRLTSIEYGLAAMHHMLRSRAESAYGRAEAPEATYRPPAYSAPAYAPPVYTAPPSPPYTPPAEPAPEEPVPAPLPRPQPARTAAPVRRTAKADPLESARRPGDKANLLTEPAFGLADDLEIIVGIGPMLGELLHDVGVYYFWQIAEWEQKDVEWVDEKLEHFKGRIERDNWVGQARELAGLPSSARRPTAA